MKENLNDRDLIQSLITYDTAFCLNHSCPRATQCFRHQAYQYKDATQKVGRIVFPDALQNGQCDYFLRPRHITAAWGFAHLYNQVKNSDVAGMRTKVMGFLGGKTSYYRYHRGEKWLNTEQQKEIGVLFKERGYEVPFFDHCKETVELTDKKEENGF